MQFIVPSPMTARTGHTQDGKESEHTLENTGPRRFLVVEQDAGTVDEQAAILFHLAKLRPMALAPHSGSKSLHGWFYCAGQSQERAHKHSCVTPSLLGRTVRRGHALSSCACQTARGTTAAGKPSTSSTRR